MAEFEFLKSLVIIFGLSAIVVFALDKLKVPPVMGFLMAGAFLGPHGLELIKDTRLVEQFAEIGVILLLFFIGLEFSLKNLLANKKTILAGGFLQVFITAAAVYAAAVLFGQDINAAIVFGFLVSLSSTALVMKLLSDRGETDSLHGRMSIGILIFQDLCAVVFILMVPALAGNQGPPLHMLWVLAKAVLIISAAIMSARWLVPAMLHQVVRTRKRELFMASIIFTCLGAAFLTYNLGLSLALGAFVAGLIISESEYAYQTIAEILPLKDSFSGLFFISIGMLLNLDFVFSNPSAIILAVVALMAIKTFAATGAVLLLGSNLRVSLHIGLILSQIGEFSFVVAIAALGAGILNENTYQMFLAAAVISMLLTPLVVSASPRVTAWVTSRKTLARLARMAESAEAREIAPKRADHVIIVGFGVNGRNLARVLKELEVPYLVLELNNDTVRAMRREEEPIFYGDGTSPVILRKMGIRKARVLVIAIADPAATRRIVKTARDLNPRLYITVRTRYTAEVEDLLVLGADEVIPEEFETSLELFSRVLQYYQMPANLIEGYTKKIREDHYRFFLKKETPKMFFRDIVALMPDIKNESFLIDKGSPAEDKSIRQMGVRKATGATVLAVRRGSRMIHPDPDLILKKGDVVFLIGEEAALKKAKALLSR